MTVLHLVCATRIIKPTIKCSEQDLAPKILPLQGKISVRALKALKINYNPIFKKHLNNIDHTISEKEAIFELDSVLNTYEISYLIRTKSLCDRNYPPHFTNRKLNSKQFAVQNYASNSMFLCS